MTMHGHFCKETASRLGLVVSFVALLTACTATHTPPVYLPSRDSITAGETVIVKGNQNIYAIAQAHNVSMREIIVLNNLKPPFALKSGQSLVLPAEATNITVAGNTAGYAKGLAPEPLSAPSGTIETMDLPPPTTPSVQMIPLDQPPAVTTSKPVIEALNAPAATSKHVATTVSPQATEAPQSLAVTNNVPPAPALPEPKVAAAASQNAAAASAAVAPVAGGAVSMIWPVQGPILSAYGDKGQGLTNDGINIGAPKGAPVVAAAGGTVVYAGNEMKGFGNLILIRHANGWVTAYAHLERTLVSKDAVVAQGDMIGTVGKTGNVPAPQLHFETRHDGKPVDPSPLIKS